MKIKWRFRLFLIRQMLSRKTLIHSWVFEQYDEREVRIDISFREGDLVRAKMGDPWSKHD